MVATAIGAPLQMLKRSRIRPLLITPAIRQGNVHAAIAALASLLAEKLQNVFSSERCLHTRQNSTLKTKQPPAQAERMAGGLWWG